MKTIITFLAFSLCLFTYSQTEGDSLMKKNIKLIQSSLGLSEKEVTLISKYDSIVFEVSKSLNKKGNEKKIRRRLDSFYAYKYTKEKLILVLKIDRKFPMLNFEFDKNMNAKDFPNFNTLDEAAPYINNSKLELIIEKSKDSL